MTPVYSASGVRAPVHSTRLDVVRDPVLYLVRGFALTWGFLISAVFVFVLASPAAGVVGLTVLVMTGVAVARFDLLHPNVWFGIPFYLYSVSMPVLIWTGRLPNSPSLQGLVELEWLAFVIVLVVVGPGRAAPQHPRIDEQFRAPAWWMIGFLIVLSLPYLRELQVGGYTSKVAVLLSHAPALRLTPIYPVIAAPYAVLLSIALQKRTIPWSMLGLVGGWAVVSFLVSGERDYVLRLVLVAGLMIHALYRPISPLLLIVAVFAGIVVIPLLAQLKEAHLTGQSAVISSNDLVFRSLEDEFISSGRNVLVLLDTRGTWPQLSGRTVLWSLQTAGLPNALFSTRTRTATSWFNGEFYPENTAAGGGVGFSLIGEGYLNFGVGGVVIWFVVLSAFLRWIYRRSSRSALWLIAYVLSMPVVIYAIRGDSATIFSQYSKHVLLPLAILWIAFRINSRLKTAGRSTNLRTTTRSA